MILQVFVLLASSFSLAGAFSNGASIANGPQVIKNLYCGREPLRRIPIHLNLTKCDGYCHARTDVRNKFTINASSNTYWSDAVNVTISSVSNSEYVIKGFAVSAINDVGTVVGMFTETNDTTVGVCYAGQKAEGNTIFHGHADPNRKSVVLKWLGPAQNYQDIKFRAWIVHSHDQIFYLESTPLHSLRNGSKTVDLPTTLVKLLGSAAQFKDERQMDVFEKSFMDRQLLGFAVTLEDPFDSLKRLPRPSDLIPAGSSRPRNVQPEQARRKPDTSSSNEISGKGSPSLDIQSGSQAAAPQGQIAKTFAGTSGDTTTSTTTATTNGGGMASTVPGDVYVNSNGIMNTMLSTDPASSAGNDVTPAVLPPSRNLPVIPALDNMTTADVTNSSGINNNGSVSNNNGIATATSSTSNTTTIATTTTAKYSGSPSSGIGVDVGAAMTIQSNDVVTTTAAPAATNSSLAADITTVMSATTAAPVPGQVATQQPDSLSNSPGLAGNVSAV